MPATYGWPPRSPRQSCPALTDDEEPVSRPDQPRGAGTRPATAGSDELPAYVYDLGALREHAAAVRRRTAGTGRAVLRGEGQPGPGDPGRAGLRRRRVRRGLGRRARACPQGRSGQAAGLRRTGARRRTSSPPAWKPERSASTSRASTSSGCSPSSPAAAPRDGGWTSCCGSTCRWAPARWTGSRWRWAAGRPRSGIDPEQVDRCLHLVAGTYPHLRLAGIHAHLASGLEAPEQLAVAEHVVAWA